MIEQSTSLQLMFGHENTQSFMGNDKQKANDTTGEFQNGHQTKTSGMVRSDTWEKKNKGIFCERLDCMT